MEIEKKVSIIAWIPIVVVSLKLSIVLGIESLGIFSPDFYLPHWLQIEQASSFFDAMVNIVLAGAIIVALVGEIIHVRHGYGSKKFWKHSAIWYAVYVVLIVGMTILVGMNFNVLKEPPIIPLIIATCLYPAIALLGLMLVVAITRCIKKKQTQ